MTTQAYDNLMHAYQRIHYLQQTNSGYTPPIMTTPWSGLLAAQAPLLGKSGLCPGAVAAFSNEICMLATMLWTDRGALARRRDRAHFAADWPCHASIVCSDIWM